MEEKIYPVAEIVNSPHQFSYENGIVVTCVQPGLARGELRAGPDSINPHGMIHGGAMATLADTVAGCCACSRGGQLRDRLQLDGVPAPSPGGPVL